MTKLLEGTCAAPVKFDRQWDFAYDGDGTRVKQVVSTFDDQIPRAITGTSVTSYFPSTALGTGMAGLYEETDGAARKYAAGPLPAASASPCDMNRRDYAISTATRVAGTCDGCMTQPRGAGMTVAMSDAEGVKYLLTDHLGSVAAITDDEGNLLDQQRYLPFGAERPNVGSITQTDLGYTGQRDLSSMGLMDYKARFYESSIGRFIQPDTLIPNPADPQGWNRYSYVINSPLNLADPTGHKMDEGCGSGKLCTLSTNEEAEDAGNQAADGPDQLEYFEESFQMFQVIDPFSFNPDSTYSFSDFPGGGDPKYFPRVPGTQPPASYPAGPDAIPGLMVDFATAIRPSVWRAANPFDQLVAMGFTTRYDGIPRADAVRTVTLHTMSIANRSRSGSVINYDVQLTDPLGRNSASRGSAGPGGRAELDLPSGITIRNGIGGVQVSIRAWTGYTGPCISSATDTLEFRGFVEFTFAP